jgi:hypothetical protein
MMTVRMLTWEKSMHFYGLLVAFAGAAWCASGEGAEKGQEFPVTLDGLGSNLSLTRRKKDDTIVLAQVQRLQKRNPV